MPQQAEVRHWIFVQPVYPTATYLRTSVLITNVNEGESNCNYLYHPGVKACRKDGIEASRFWRKIPEVERRVFCSLIIWVKYV